MTDDMFGAIDDESGDVVQAEELVDPNGAVTEDDSDEMAEGYSPPDREPYSLSHETTATEQRDGESLADHLAEEEPEVGAADAG